MRTALVPLFFVLVAPSWALAGEALPTSQQIFDRVQKADGAPWESERKATVWVRNGTTFRRTVWRRDKDYREDDQNGPFETQSGNYHGQRWRQDENGVTLLVQRDPGNERANQETSVVRRVQQPVDGYVIETRDAQRHTRRVFVDGASWRIVREEVATPNATAVTTYDDFRTVAGRTEAFHWKTADGHPENTVDVTVTSDLPANISDADLRIPGFRRELFTLPDGMDHVDLPARILNGRIYVRATVGQRGLDFLLDTGASTLTLDGAIASQLGLSVIDQRSMVTVQRHSIGEAIVPRIDIGALRMKDVVVSVIPSLPKERTDTTIVGILGLDFLAQAVFKIDYEHGRVTAFRSDAFTPPGDPLTSTLPVRLGTGSPETTVVINGVKADRFTIDTGAAGTFLLFNYFVSRYPDVLKNGTYGEGESTFWGVGGFGTAKPYMLHELLLGKTKFTDTPGYVVASDSAFDWAQDGLIGSDFLRLYDVWLDYEYSRIYLVPNAHGLHLMGY
ncbi:MAG: aspartyl protease family protein [Candidatus Eremiobacteraeota bacterium]|nr:aspartyl protease family protein [Candidatus Eremiobacteraeota bacterium]